MEPFGHHSFFCVKQLHTLLLEEPARGAPLGTFGAEGGGGPTGSPRAAGMGRWARGALGVVGLAGLLAEGAGRSSAPTAPLSLAGCVVPSTVSAFQNASCTDPLLQPAGAADIALARGEVGQFQILLEGAADTSGTAVNLHFSELDGPGGSRLCGPGEACWEWWQVGYVFCNASSRVPGTSSGWYPDPLLPVPEGGVLLEPGQAQPLWARLTVPRGARPGPYDGVVEVMDAASGRPLLELPLRVLVWDFETPAVGTGAWDAIFSFTYAPSAVDNATAHPPQLSPPSVLAWQDMLARHRMPADSTQITKPRPVEEVQRLAAQGQRWINLMNVAKHRGVIKACNVTEAQVTMAVEALGPTVTAVRKAGLMNRVYVYGFDEAGEECVGGIRRMFGALKAKFPDLRTAAALDWVGGLPGDFPSILDLWVCHIRFHSDANAEAWAARGGTYFLYHSIEPHQPGRLNTFIERPLLDSRALLWLGFGRPAVSGWLYYQVASWATGCPANPRPHTPIQRLEGTAKTDFHPGNCVWWPHWPFWANGDGQYTYPGPGATPVGSVRLANLLDGLEDAELLARLEDARARELVTGVAAGLDDFANDGGRALEAARRAAAAEIMAQSEARRTAP